MIYLCIFHGVYKSLNQQPICQISNGVNKTGSQKQAATIKSWQIDCFWNQKQQSLISYVFIYLLIKQIERRCRKINAHEIESSFIGEKNLTCNLILIFTQGQGQDDWGNLNDFIINYLNIVIRDVMTMCN